MLEPLKDSPTLKKLQALVQQREDGQITDAEFERRSRQFWIELKHRADKEREKVKAWAIENRKVRDEAEYKRLCAHYHDEYGDSFHNYLTSIYAGANFLTLNTKMLDDARLLEIRFGGHIVDPEQAAREAEAEKLAEAQEETAKASPDGSQGDGQQ
jgi:hypothetical protein